MDEKKMKSTGLPPQPEGLGGFDTLIRGLLGVPKAEIDEAEAGRKLAAKKRRAARKAKSKKKP